MTSRILQRMASSERRVYRGPYIRRDEGRHCATGTTTLATALVDHYRRAAGFESIVFVPEYGRQFTYELHAETEAALGRPVGPADLVWLPEHFARIARQQNALENAAALACPLVIADTDALATELWERRYLGSTSPETALFGTTELPRRDVYLVTDHAGVAFEKDGWRDGDHIRAQMTGWFIEELTRRGHSWVLLSGSHDERMRYAVRLIDALWARGSTFASPDWADRTRLPENTEVSRSTRRAVVPPATDLLS
ncbi:AAA family ATPase [Glaciibacter flavus]|uniref:AAA family ATPase n=1 Tax=Orlajensenia flava TaxID=2565934 RepID=UPI003AFFC7EB